MKCPLCTTKNPDVVLALAKGEENLIKVLETFTKFVVPVVVLFPDPEINRPVTDFKFSPLIKPEMLSLILPTPDIPDITGAGKTILKKSSVIILFIFSFVFEVEKLNPPEL